MTKGNGLPCKKCGTSEWDSAGHCVNCKRESNRRSRANDPNKERERRRQWDADNPERKREANRRWREANPEKQREAERRCNAAKPELKRERDRRWSASHPEANRANQHRRRANKYNTGGYYTATEWKALVAQYDGHCCYPGCDRTDLHADHVVPLIKGGSNNIDNIQPLCAHHNQSKGTKTADYRHSPGIIRWIQKKLFG